MLSVSQFQAQNLPQLMTSRIRSCKECLTPTYDGPCVLLLPSNPTHKSSFGGRCNTIYCSRGTGGSLFRCHPVFLQCTTATCEPLVPFLWLNCQPTTRLDIRWNALNLRRCKLAVS